MVVNDPALTARLAQTFTTWFGADRVAPEPPTAGGEDFARYGLTTDRVPILTWWVGSAAPDKIAEAKRTGVPLPSNHSANFAPVPEPTIKAGVISMTAAALELLAR
ncbi:MAG: hypothetical protein ABIZ49_04885 [Opitutaceae bacterium]